VFVQTLLQCKSSKYYTLWMFVCVCVCSLSYTAHNAHASYGHLWRLWLYNVFPRYLTNDTIFGRKSFGIKCRFRFFLQIWSETFFTLKRIEQDTIKNVYWAPCKVTLFSSEFNETSVFSKYLGKFSNIKFHENLFSGSRVVVPCGQTDGQIWRCL
jgi:hypothetical protein